MIQNPQLIEADIMIEDVRSVQRFPNCVKGFLFLQFSLCLKFIVIVKQKDRFGVIFLLLWLSEHTQGGGGLCPGVSRHEHIFCVIKNQNE